jgi:hypothetical protein
MGNLDLIFESEKSKVNCWLIGPSITCCLSESLINQICQKNASLRPLVSIIVKSKNDIKRLKDLIELNKLIIGTDVYQTCQEELKELADDYNWIHSETGKKVLDNERWITTARETIKDQQYIYIGKSWIDPTKIIVGGICSDNEEKQELEVFFKELNPPINLEFRFIVKTE